MVDCANRLRHLRYSCLRTSPVIEAQVVGVVFLVVFLGVCLLHKSLLRFVRCCGFGLSLNSAILFSRTFCARAAVLLSSSISASRPPSLSGSTAALVISAPRSRRCSAPRSRRCSVSSAALSCSLEPKSPGCPLVFGSSGPP